MTRPRARFRSIPEDFLVDEIPAYTPSGAGQHLYVTFRKRGLTTFQAVQQLAKKLNVAERDVGTAGLKDRHGITTQVASVSFPEAAALPALDALSSDEVEVLSLVRHGNKLRTGHLRGNRFRVVLRDLDAADVVPVCERFAEIAVTGLPNRFGAQRFGWHGDNAEVAARWIAGKAQPPRDRKVKRLMFSAWQSWLFHHVLERRIADGTWDKLLEGDLAQRGESGRTWHWSEADRDAPPPVAREGATSRDGSRETGWDVEEPVSATGPMYGVKMRWPAGKPEEIEREILRAHVEDPTVLQRWSMLGEGARRVLRLAPSVLRAEPLPGESGCVVVTCVLPAGAYVTSVLEAVCETIDASRAGPGAPADRDVAEPTDEEQEDP